MFIVASCRKDKPPTDNPDDIPQNQSVFILNEGNFQWGNASVSFYNLSTGEFIQDIFKQTNQRPLGDVAHSMYSYNGRLYIVINNSNKIEVVDAANFSSVGVINGLLSPRYFLPLNTTKAYVTDLYSNAVSIVDLALMTKTGEIKLNGSTEEMVMVNNMVYITNTRKSNLYLVDPQTDMIVDSIPVGFGSSTLAVDKDNMIWVGCMGDNSQAVNGSIYQVNPLTRQVLKTLALNNSLDIWDKIRFNRTGDTLYYMNKGLFRFGIYDTQLPSIPLIAQGSSLFNGVNVNPENGDIYICDAIDYVQKGRVLVYSGTGIYKTTVSAGIIPREITYY